ncbi:MAG: metal ABC transporter permease [Bacilli bacterium]|nr:metal ABC transporter permease [Bacilli bacterium]MDD3348382.1 metal ABC transporter permease [Bacilli bacterium]MDD4056208.1 metal ABC transporter permease [Bacilli bacterium]MDY0208710.1 metal ABC transporter permease [Bacilli bacterium]
MILSSFFRAIFEYDFMLYALIAGIIVGILAPLIGSVVVIRRLSFIADTLSHFSLAGVCFGVFLSRLITIKGFDPALMGIVFSISGTFLIEKLRGFYKNYKELSMPIVMSFGVALSGLFINLSNNIDAKFTTSLLFGSIYSVSATNLIIILVIAVIIFIVIFTSYKKIVTLCFDETYAAVSGINVKSLQLLLTIILALVISLFIDIVGVLLIASLMIIPVAAAILVGDSFLNTVITSIIFSEFSLLTGFIISYNTNLTTGPVIILINILILAIVMSISKVKSRHHKTKEI